MLRTPPPAVLNLLIINGLVFLATSLFPHFKNYFVVSKSNALGMHDTAYIPQEGEERYVIKQGDEGVYLPAGPNDFKPYQIVTYFFGHAGFMHIFFNMLALYSIGTAVEYAMGSKRFIEFYLFCGVVAGIALAFLDPSPIPVVGASTAVSGVLVAFGLMFPEAELILFPIPIPIKAKYLVAGTFVLSLVLFISSLRGADGGNVSHFGHLAGMFAAVFFFFGRRLMMR